MTNNALSVRNRIKDVVKAIEKGEVAAQVAGGNLPWKIDIQKGDGFITYLFQIGFK